jgi:transposase-like protein
MVLWLSDQMSASSFDWVCDWLCQCLRRTSDLLSHWQSQIRRAQGITSRFDRLRNAGMLTQAEIAEELGIHPSTVKKWRSRGLLAAHAFNDKNEYLYEPLGNERPIKQQGMQLTDPRRFQSVAPERTNEVQHEA